MAGAPADTVAIDATLDLALRMADRADAIAMQDFQKRPRVEIKVDGSPVTAVDRAIESELRRMIVAAQPDAGVLGEEFPEKHGIGRWVIDPIDGTALYVDGDPRFAVLIAYEIDEAPVVGVVSAPALGLRWWAARGRGASIRDGGTISAARVSITGDLVDAHGLLLGGGVFRADGIPGIANPAAAWDRLVGGGMLPVRLEVSWEAVRVASKEFDLALTAGAWWDVAPLSIIVTEAGGAAMYSGTKGDRVGMVLTNRLLFERVRSLLALRSDSSRS